MNRSIADRQSEDQVWGKKGKADRPLCTGWGPSKSLSLSRWHRPFFFFVILLDRRGRDEGARLVKGANPVGFAIALDPTVRGGQIAGRYSVRWRPRAVGLLQIGCRFPPSKCRTGVLYCTRSCLMNR